MPIVIEVRMQGLITAEADSTEQMDMAMVTPAVESSKAGRSPDRFWA